MFTIITFNSFAAYITSILSVQLVNIRDVEDLLESDYEMGYVKNSDDEVYLRVCNQFKRLLYNVFFSMILFFYLPPLHLPAPIRTYSLLHPLLNCFLTLSPHSLLFSSTHSCFLYACMILFRSLSRYLSLPPYILLLSLSLKCS